MQCFPENDVRLTLCEKPMDTELVAYFGSFLYLLIIPSVCYEGKLRCKFI